MLGWGFQSMGSSGPFWRSLKGFGHDANGPHEARQLPGYRHVDHLRGFAGFGQFPVLGVEVSLRLPGMIGELLVLSFPPSHQGHISAGKVAVGPGGLDQEPPHPTIARFGDGATADFVLADPVFGDPLSTGKLRRSQAHVTHEFPCRLKAGKVVDLGHESSRSIGIHAAQGRQCLGDRGLGPLLLEALQFGINFDDLFHQSLDMIDVSSIKTSWRPQACHFDPTQPMPMDLGPMELSLGKAVTITTQHGQYFLADDPELGGECFLLAGIFSNDQLFLVGDVNGTSCPLRKNIPRSMASILSFFLRFPGILGISEGAITMLSKPRESRI